MVGTGWRSDCGSHAGAPHGTAANATEGQAAGSGETAQVLTPWRETGGATRWRPFRKASTQVALRRSGVSRRVPHDAGIAASGGQLLAMEQEDELVPGMGFQPGERNVGVRALEGSAVVPDFDDQQAAGHEMG